MKTITVDVSDYLSQDEMKEIVESEVRRCVACHLRGSEAHKDRLFINLTHEFVVGLVNEHFDGKLSEMLRAKIAEVIESLSKYDVFREADVWERNASKGRDMLNEEIALSRPRLKDKILQIIDEYPFNEINRDVVAEVTYQCIADRLFSPKMEG